MLLNRSQNNVLPKYIIRERKKSWMHLISICSAKSMPSRIGLSLIRTVRCGRSVRSQDFPQIGGQFSCQHTVCCTRLTPTNCRSHCKSLTTTLVSPAVELLLFSIIFQLPSTFQFTSTTSKLDTGTDEPTATKLVIPKSPQFYPRMLAEYDDLQLDLWISLTFGYTSIRIHTRTGNAFHALPTFRLPFRI